MPTDKQESISEEKQNRAGSYEQLKSWYLARLRKQALEFHDKNLTPAGLIRADRNLIENMALAASAPAGTGKLAATDMAPLMQVLAVYAGSMLVLFMLLLNSVNGNFPDTLGIFFQLVFGTLAARGADHETFSRIGLVAYVLPMVTYALPCLLFLITEQTRTASSAKVEKPAGRSADCLLRNALTVILLAILSISPFSVLSALGPETPASDPIWHDMLCVSAWGLIFLTLLCAQFSLRFLRPLKVVLNTLSKATNKQMEQKTCAGNLQELVQELLRARDELASRETLIADASPDLLFVLAPDETILSCNWTSQNLLGFLPEELTAKSLAELVLPQDLDVMRTTLSAVQSNKQAASFDCRLQTKERKAVDMRCTIEFSSTHNCFFAGAHDISDQKTLERAKREFVSMLGHDIRVPLGSALLTVQVLEQGIYGELPDAAENMLSEVELSLKRLVKLLEELLEFEQLSAGKMRLEIVPLNTEQLVLQALSELSGQALKKNIEVEALGEKVQLEGDAGKLLRVIINLVSNAIKFSPSGSKVSVLTQRPRSASVEIRVTDQGPGIAPEYQKLIFERYERLESTAHEQGSGLGLAIARSIVESHGGLIGVESQTGQGSTFWFTLPLRVAESQSSKV